MDISPTLSLAFAGECEAAFGFYEQCLGGRISMMLKWGESPMAGQGPDGWDDKVIHAAIRIGDTEITASDVPPLQYEAPAGFEILLNIGDPAEAERVFRELGENGRVRMPLQQTFWAELFGVIIDRFGIPWAVNCGMPQASEGDA